MHDYAGAIHFHSSHSYDARVSLSDIIQSAQKSGLHFAVLTDHFRLDALAEAGQRYHDTLLFIVGEEVSPRYNHYLALGIQKPIVTWKSDNHPQRVIDAVNAQGGFGFISHPDHAGAPLFGSRAYPWIDWSVQGYAGMGIWDLMSDWQRSLASPWSALCAFFRPSHALRGPLPKTIERWDALTQKGHCVAIGEIDNHGNQRSFFGISKRIFPFEFAFRTIRTHVLLEKPLTRDAKTDEQMVLDALKRGQSYVSLDYWNDPTGFSFSVLHDSAQAWPGGEITRQKETILEAKLPQPGKLLLYRDGRLIKEDHHRSALQWDVTMPGVYRIEAQQMVSGNWKPWIYSNPIWVR